MQAENRYIVLALIRGFRTTVGMLEKLLSDDKEKHGYLEKGKIETSGSRRD